mmetsp:Transcript_27552/g.95225  ORF Transcript_27552/g.95225 Transcript_27552/m.95225 type:complete len:276 (-) Transcript_27552:1122-1949(-)
MFFILEARVRTGPLYIAGVVVVEGLGRLQRRERRVEGQVLGLGGPPRRLCGFGCGARGRALGVLDEGREDRLEAEHGEVGDAVGLVRVVVVCQSQYALEEFCKVELAVLLRGHLVGDGHQRAAKAKLDLSLGEVVCVDEVAAVEERTPFGKGHVLWHARHVALAGELAEDSLQVAEARLDEQIRSLTPHLRLEHRALRRLLQAWDRSDGCAEPLQRLGRVVEALPPLESETRSGFEELEAAERFAWIPRALRALRAGGEEDGIRVGSCERSAVVE